MKQTLNSRFSILVDFTKRLIFTLSMTALLAVAAGYFDSPKVQNISLNESQEFLQQNLDSALK
jgi:hypothetical protein